jgi:hypothetical protein
VLAIALHATGMLAKFVVDKWNMSIAVKSRAASDGVGSNKDYPVRNPAQDDACRGRLHSLHRDQFLASE